MNKYELENIPLFQDDGFVFPLAKSLTRDEKAILLMEQNRFTADTLAEHRWQSIYVGRGDQVYEFPRDLGPTSNFPDIQDLLIFSGGLDTVAQLMDMAEEERGLNKTKRVLDEVHENSTLIADAIRQTEQIHQAVVRNKRTYKVPYERKLF